MESTANRPLSGLFPFLVPHSTPKTVIQPQPESQALQLSKMIKQQKRSNDLVQVYSTDSEGKISVEWVQACSL